MDSGDGGTTPNCDQRPAPNGAVDAIAAIELRGVQWSDGSAESLGPIDLRIESGERVTITGNDSSLLTRLIAGVVEPTAGTVRIAGHAPTLVAAAAVMSVMVDPIVLSDDMTLSDHLTAAAAIAPGGSWRDDIADLAKRFALTDRLDERLFTFSRGMRQKAALCMAFVRDFDVLILDEPFGGLDVQGRAQLTDLLAAAGQLGCTVVVAAGDPELAVGVDRLVALRDGAIVETDRPG